MIRLRPLVQALLAALVFVACGARTGLEQPCVADLLRTRPTIILLTARNSDLVNVRYEGRYTGEHLRDHLGELVPFLAEASNFGLQVHPRMPRLGDDRYGCAGTDYLHLPIGVHSPQSVVDTWLRAGRYVGPAVSDWGFEGLNPLQPTLPHSGRLLLAATLRGSASFLVMIVTDTATCSSDGPKVIPPVASRQALASVRALRAMGIKTLVVLYNPNLRRESDFMQDLNDMAWEGGLADHPVDVTESTPYTELALTYGLYPGAMREQVRRRILTSYWCRGTVAMDWDRADEVVVTRSDRRVIPHDPTRRNGWDRVDEASGTVEIFGDACRSVQDDRQGVRFYKPGVRCQ